MKRLASLLGCLALGGWGGLTAADPGKPNIIYILADDLGYADAGFMGNRVIRTPHLDRLAREGTILTSLYGQPNCSPTRTALLTGRYAVHTGVYSPIPPGASWGMPLGERTMADALREGGYETAVVGKWHLGEKDERYRPTRRGFEHQYGSWFGMLDFFTHQRFGKLDWYRDDVPVDDPGYGTQLLADEACTLIRGKQPDKPLFLYLSFHAVHIPLQAPAEEEAAYPELTGEQKTYAAMVTAMDKAVGQVVAALDAAGLRDNTLIVFSSDNGGWRAGEIADNSPLRSGKGSIYEGGIRLSAFVNWPGRVPTGRTVDEPLHVIDWLPTFARLAGVPAETNLPLDGKDAWAVLTAGARSPHEAILLTGTLGPLPGAIRMGGYKLLIGATDRPTAAAPRLAPAEMPVELYDLATDSGERINLAASHPEKVAELRAHFDLLNRNAVENLFRPSGQAAPE